MPTQKEIEAAAVTYANKNKKTIAKKFTDLKKYPSSNIPVTIFMAGSPGAGKTEFSKNLLVLFKKRPNVIRIDGDELRKCFADYNGKNSKLFQGGISVLIEKIQDLALKQKQNFILDGTLWKKDKAVKNINRSLKKNRIVFIFYVYQPPKVAWDFTKKRELEEGRNIPKKAFIEQFLGAKDTVNHLREKYGEELVIYLVKKNHKKMKVEKLIELESGQTIDQHITQTYTKSALEKSL